MPWSSLCAVIEPHYPEGVGGRPPIGLERMLPIHFIQHWFNLVLGVRSCFSPSPAQVVVVHRVGIKPGRRCGLALVSGHWTAAIRPATNVSSDGNGLERFKTRPLCPALWQAATRYRAALIDNGKMYTQ